MSECVTEPEEAFSHAFTSFMHFPIHTLTQSRIYRGHSAYANAFLI